MRRRHLGKTLLVALMMNGAPAAAATLHVDDFSPVGTSGWIGGAAPSRQTTDGPAGAGDAYLQISAFGSNLATYNVGEIWTGSFLDAGAGVVRVDMRNAPDSDPLEMRLVLFGPGDINVRWISACPQLVLPDGIWRSYKFPLAEAALELVRGTVNYDDLMNGVVRFMLRHNPTPSDEGESVSATLGLDNIELAAASPAGPADFNDDTFVDGVDLGIWSGAYGVSMAGDADYDCTTAGPDYLIWQRDFAPAAPATGQAASVPEPKSIALASVAALVVTCRCRLTGRRSDNSRVSQALFPTSHLRQFAPTPYAAATPRVPRPLGRARRVS